MGKKLINTELIKKYPQYVDESVEYDDVKKRQTCLIACIDCKNQRKIYTSDLHQVKRCEMCTKAYRKSHRSKKNEEI